MPVEPFTPAEIRRILVESGLIGADPAVIASQINATMGETADKLVEQFLAGIRGPIRPEALERARAQAERQTRRIYGRLAETELTKISKAIEGGIADGLGPDQIARRLDQIKGLDPQRAARYQKHRELLEAMDISDEDLERRLDRFYQKELRDRKRVIARTESNFAQSESNQLIAEDRGQKFKSWITSGDDRVSDMDIDNESAGWIPIDADFPSGHKTPPSHPNCRCTLAYRTELTQAARDRATRRAERTREAKTV